MSNKSYGLRFNEAVSLMSTHIQCEDSPLAGTLAELSSLPVTQLDKYPLAIRRIIRALWDDIEIYLNYFYWNNGSEEKIEAIIRGVALLEALEDDLNKI